MKNVFFLLIVSFFFSCSKDKLSKNECEDLKLAIINMDENALPKLINDLCHDLKPIPATGDDLGHRQNINILMSRLETNCTIETELICYACIKTNPLETEIKVTVTTDTGTYASVIDIATPEADKLSYENIHK